MLYPIAKKEVAHGSGRRSRGCFSSWLIGFEKSVIKIEEKGAVTAPDGNVCEG